MPRWLLARRGKGLFVALVGVVLLSFPLWLFCETFVFVDASYRAHQLLLSAPQTPLRVGDRFTLTASIVPHKPVTLRTYIERSCALTMTVVPREHAPRAARAATCPGRRVERVAISPEAPLRVDIPGSVTRDGEGSLLLDLGAFGAVSLHQGGELALYGYWHAVSHSPLDALENFTSVTALTVEP